MAKLNMEPFKLNSLQIETIVNKLVPLIAAPKDHEFFRAVLTLKAEESTSGQFAYFVHGLLSEAELLRETT